MTTHAALPLSLTMVLGATHSMAQDATVPPADAPSPGKAAHALDKLDVYGSELSSASPKFTAPLIDTPQSVTVIPQALMQDAGSLSLQDALRNVPGITFGAGEGGNPIGDRPSIRGFNSTASLYVDGMRDIGIQTRDIFDLEQIEVIKGPDSSIAGRSAGGGSINLISKSARLDDSLEATGMYGSAQQYRGALDANVKISDTVAARINVMHMGGGVPGRDEAVRTDKTGVAPTITFGLGTPTRVTLSYYRLQDRSTPDYGVPVDLNTGLPSSESDGVSRRTFYGLSNRDYRNAVVDVGSASIETALGDRFTMRSQLRYTHNVNNYLVTSPDDAAGNTLNGLVYRLPIGRFATDNALISQTDVFGHFKTGLIRHDIDVGVEISQERLTQAGDGNWNGLLVNSSAGSQGFGAENCYVPGDPNYAALQASHDCTTLHSPNPNDPWSGTVSVNPNHTYYKTRDGAAYAFDTITLTPHWKLNGGFRWDVYESSTLAPADATANTASHLSFLSYQASVMYKPVESGTIYLTTSTSALPQDLAFSDQDQALAASSFAPSTSGTKPVKTTTVELGTKWNFFANRLLLSGDVFTETAKDAAIQVEPGLWEQVGKTRTRGVELSGNGSISESWNLIAGYSFLDAKLIAGSYYDAVGKPLVDTPRNTFSLFSTYHVLQPLTVGAGAYYRSQQVGYYGPPDRTIPGYWRADAMAKWSFNPHLNVQLNLQNLFDKEYYTKSYYQFALPAAGRTWLLTLDLKI